MKPLNIAIAQVNPTVGDFEGNLQRIYSRVREAHKKRADIVIFSEMSICGYPVWDLANKPRFVAAGLRALKKLQKMTARLRPLVIVGFIDRQAGEKKSFNALAAIYRGGIVHKQYKTLLPTYDVFLEQIFFQPGGKSRLFEFKGWKIGTSICEDLWDDDYEEKPTQKLSELGAEFIVNISASPFHQNVGPVREALVTRQSRKCGVPIVYVNQTGAQDDLIFDGRSLVATPDGRIRFRAPAFEEGLFMFKLGAVHPRPRGNPERVRLVYAALKLGIRDYCRKNGFTHVVLGLSGGIDSGLTAALAADALGAENVLGVTMPGPYSSEGSIQDSRELAEKLGIEFREIPITGMYDEARRQRYGETKGREITLADENFQARLRGLELMYISNSEGRLLLSTGNKSELAVGYCTLYGDMCGGLCVLGDVFKTEVYKLARFRNGISPVIPAATLRKPPSAELRPNQTDQDSLPPYDQLDKILRDYVEENLSRAEIEARYRSRISPSVIFRVLNLVDHNEYKRRQAAPTLRISTKAWFGRRMPITNRFRD
ncbi:MAG: NAD+ synthase [Candidatus Omnitrophica bacterium]|nr:NAD+ synthase [Candidatus Omnitrophota bacterium]